MPKYTLDPIEIGKLDFLNLTQAQIYCIMDPATFRSFCARRAVPYQCETPNYPNAKRRYSRALLYQAMLDDMTMGAEAQPLSRSASKRVLQILGEEQ